MARLDKTIEMLSDGRRPLPAAERRRRAAPRATDDIEVASAAGRAAQMRLLQFVEHFPSAAVRQPLVGRQGRRLSADVGRYLRRISAEWIIQSDVERTDAARSAAADADDDDDDDCDAVRKSIRVTSAARERVRRPTYVGGT